MVVAGIMVLVVIGAAVGGAVGGQTLRSSQTLDGTYPGTVVR